MVPANDPTTIPALVASAAARSPHARAIGAPGRAALSFARLSDLIASVSGVLAASGVARADRVAIVLPNGPEMAVSFLGVSAAAVAAPLNPAYRAAEFAFFFDDLRPRALILPGGADSPARDVAGARGIPILEMRPIGDDGAGALTLDGRVGERGGSPVDAPGPGDVALVLHTSGTTARPKMVPLTHASLSESARNIARAFGLGPSDCCLNVMPLFHVHGLVAALLAPLASGGSVVCTPGFLAPAFCGWLSESRPTWYTAVPSMHQSVLARVGDRPDVLAGHSLRFIRSSSSALPPTLMRDLEAAFGVPVIEAYGMTEAAHQIAANPLPPRSRKPGSVGLPAGPAVAVVDERGALLERNRRGEIVIRGSTVIAGYLASADVNERSFVDGWFRTGDSGYLDDDGYVFVTGRIKEVINRGGEKISPREVEEVLLAHPSVADAVVFAVPDDRLGEEVGAAIVQRPGIPADESAIRRFVSTRVTDFKVPRVIRIVSALPLGPTGKVQRIGMAERLGLESVRHEPRAPSPNVPPRTPLEHQLAAIWRDVLGVADAGIEDDFFAVGGDSMLATMFVVHATETLGAHVSLVDFMEAPTIAGLSAAIARRAPLAPHDGTGRLVAIQPEGLACPLFCVPPLDGTLVGFGLLSMHVGRDQPMWGFAPLRARAGGEPHTIEEIAGAYVETMRAMCGDGPYLLLGDCFGGFVAYEMACQLGRRGDDVALLAMVDAPFRRGWRRNRSFAGAVAARARHALARGRFQLSTIGRLRGNERTAYVRDRGAALASSIRGHVLGLAYRAARIARVTPPLAARDPRQANAWAEARYEPGSFDGRVAFFKTSAPTAGFYPSRLLGWEGLFLGRTRVVELPGEHRLRYQPETLKALARGLREELADEQIGAGSRTGPPAGRIASTPPVSIGLPVYNGERFVSATIESILAQSFTDFELIISDNASTDRTEEICRAFALRDPRVRYFRSDTNLGAAANFNRVLARARGRYFKWAAHDDLLAPTWLARAVEVLDKDASAVLCQSDVTIIDENGIGIGRDDLSLHHVNGGRASARFGDLVLVDHRCHGIFGLIRSDVLRRTRGFARYVGADRVLLAELGLMGRFRTIDEPLFFERDHPARSVNALPLHRRAAFFDPGAGSRRIFPHWRLYRECFGVVRRAPLGTVERFACYGHLLRWPWANMNWARLVSDLLIAVNPDLDRRLTAMGRRLARPQ